MLIIRLLRGGGGADCPLSLLLSGREVDQVLRLVLGRLVREGHHGALGWRRRGG